MAEMYLPKKKIKVRGGNMMRKLMKPLALNKHKDMRVAEVNEIVDALKTCKDLNEAYECVFDKIGMHSKMKETVSPIKRPRVDSLTINEYED